MFFLLFAAAVAFLLLLVFVGLRYVHGVSLGVPLLRAIVSTEDGFHFFVKLDDLHSDTKPVEYVWLVLLSAAKILFVMGNDREFAKPRTDLIRAMELIGRIGLNSDSDVVGLCSRQMTVVATPLAPPSRMRLIATVGFLNTFTRGL